MHWSTFWALRVSLKCQKVIKFRYLLIRIDTHIPLKSQPVNQLIFQLRVTQTEQRLQKRGFDHT